MSALADVLVGRLRGELPRHADPQRAVAMAAYMRDRFPFLGIARTPLSGLIRQAWSGLPEPTGADVDAVARACWELPEREYQYAACAYLRRHVRVLDDSFLGTARHLIVTKSWWDTVDTLAVHVVGPLIRAYPETVRLMDDWAAGGELWLTRTAILHQLQFRGGTDAQRLFRYCASRADHTDFFIRKAIGWALREYARTDPDAVRIFVEGHPELSGLSRREALKNLR